MPSPFLGQKMKLDDFFPQDNNGSVRRDDAELLRTLVHILKPENIVELGTFVGASAITMAQACKDNGKGMVYTCDIDDHGVRAKAEEFGVANFLTFFHGECEQFLGEIPGTIDMVFYDANAARESYEHFFEALKPRMTRGGLYIVHDYKTRAEGHQPFVNALKEQHIMVNTEKGISIIQVW